MKVRQQLEKKDFQHCSDFSYWFLKHCNNLCFLSNFVISDKASFTMKGAVNTCNVREYAPKGQVPKFIYERNDS